MGSVCNHLLIGISQESFFRFCFVYVPRSAKHVSCSVLLRHTGTSSPSHVCCHPPMPGRGGAGYLALLSPQSPGWQPPWRDNKCLKYGKSFNQTLRIFPRWGTALQGSRLSTLQEPLCGHHEMILTFCHGKTPVLYQKSQFVKRKV